MREVSCVRLISICCTMRMRMSSRWGQVQRLSATILLALLEECNPDPRDIVAAFTSFLQSRSSWWWEEVASSRMFGFRYLYITDL